MKDNIMASNSTSCEDCCHSVTNARSGPGTTIIKKTNPSYLRFNVTVMEGFAKLIAEALGTAFLLFGGCMGCITWNENTPSWSGAVSFGLVVMIVIQCYGHVSGAHLNPAVTIAAVIYRLISVPMAILYFLAQLIGATIGYRALIALTPSKAIGYSAGQYGFCQTAPNDELTEVEVFACEYIATTVLITLCCGAWDPRNNTNQDSIGIKFGFTIAILAHIFGPYTGCSMNPVRTFAPAFWSEKYPMHWIYWIAPLLAALVTSFSYRIIFMEKPEKDLEAVQPLRQPDDLPKV